MTTDFKPYPAMKDSGVEWLGEVPEHWELIKLRNILHNKNERNRPDLTLLSVMRERGVIIRDLSNQETNHNFIPDDLTNYKVVRVGQFAMNKMKAWQGSYGVSEYEGIVSPAYFVFTLEKVTGAFFNQSIRSKAYVPFFTQASDGVRIGQWDLSQSRMREITFSLPPLPEQSAIVRYLDYMDRRIRRLVQAKRKLIKLLTEQKQAVIHRAVTRGLDPDVPLKDSGVEWLGKVPEHWGVVRLRNVIKSVTSGSRGWSSYAADEGPLFIRVANLNRDSIDLRFDNVVRLKLPETSEVIRTRVQPGDLLLSITAYIGSVAVVPDRFEEAYVSQHVARCSLKDQSHNPRWLAYVLLSNVGQTHGKLSLNGGTKDGLSLDDVRNYPLLIPPKREQEKLVDNIDKTTANIDTAIARANREIDLLNEYRTRLIADVVTGKLDVRNAAAGLPEVDPLADNDTVSGGAE